MARTRWKLSRRANKASFRRHSIPKADNVLGVKMARGGTRR